MAAANTDLLKKLSRKWVSQIGSGGVADGSTTTIPLSSTTNLPADTAVVATIDRVDSNGAKTPTLEESVIGVVSGSNLVTCTRGAEGTAQAHSAGAVVEILVTAKGYNDIVDWGLVEHSQLGVHDSTKVVSLDTGAIDSLWNGWITSSDTWTYASATTFTIAGVDRTAMFPKGTKLKLTNSTVKYFYVVGSAFSTNTTITVTGGSDYTLADPAITSPYYSYASCPQGFPAEFTYAPSYSASGSMTWTDVTTNLAKFSIEGTMVTVWLKATGTTGGTANNALKATLPVEALNSNDLIAYGAIVRDGASVLAGVAAIQSGTPDTIAAYRYDLANYGLAANHYLRVTASYTME